MITGMFLKESISRLYPELDANEFHLHEGKTSDYTFNQIHVLSKILKKPPSDIANEIVLDLKSNSNSNSVIDVTLDITSNVISINMSNIYLTEKINELLMFTIENNNLPVPEKHSENVICDYSSPNVAKEMHVGHLRSTIIGESLCRIHEYLGDNVNRINHIGDWGTQFGMLITYIKKFNIPYHQLNISDLTISYKEAKKLFDADPDFKQQSRLETYNLQQGSKENIAIWKFLCELSMKEFDKIYAKLGTHSIVKGESFYHNYMVDLVNELENKLVDHNGMKVIFSGNKYLIMVKGDGGYTYDTSDLTALKYRLHNENADRIIYVVDISQETHFDSLFSVANDLGFIGNKKVEYVGFGMVTGNDGKKIKTRAGETVKLSTLLDEAYESALKLTTSSDTNNNDKNKIEKIATKISLNCIKYSDLSNPRLNNYKFSTEKMLNTKGNTAVYLMYAMARCKSILRKVESHYKNTNYISELNQTIIIENNETRKLVYLVLKYKEIILKAAETSSPHYLCNYLYSLVTQLTKFYEKNRCIEFSNENVIVSFHDHRICLIYLTNILINILFGLIGLEQIEQI